MTDNPRMVDLPWHDGTTRTVPEGTAYMAVNGFVYLAQDGGCISARDAARGGRIHSYSPASAAVRIFTEAPEPPVKVNVPTGLAAVVSTPVYPNEPGYVLARKGWRGLETDRRYDPSEVANELRAGARVLFEGVDE
ncbi:MULTISPECIES: hypothetical protein [Dermacoccus]|uniref:hypothetical protein n=1 Tax=Dermacoccus TaxID=57495 RepID=UPI00093C181E|nr:MULTISPECIES: hypothetical protein [Dermacoccus]